MGLPSKETLRWRLVSSKLIGTSAQLSTCQGVREVTAEGNGELPQSCRDFGLPLDQGGVSNCPIFRQRRRGRPLCPHISHPLDAGCSWGGVGSLGGKSILQGHVSGRPSHGPTANNTPGSSGMISSGPCTTIPCRWRGGPRLSLPLGPPGEHKQPGTQAMLPDRRTPNL